MCEQVATNLIEKTDVEQTYAGDTSTQLKITSMFDSEQCQATICELCSLARNLQELLFTTHFPPTGKGILSHPRVCINIPAPAAQRSFQSTYANKPLDRQQ